MRRMTTCFLVFLMISALWVPCLASAATERRIALVIGNGSYETGPLNNPANDATDMAATLRTLGFEVILKKNVRYQEMEEAVEDFGKRLRQGGVGLFYYAGHGVQVAGVNYLIPIGARINKESDVKYQAVDANKILDEMANANNGLNIVLLDACRDNPYAHSLRSASRGLAIISTAPEGTFISFATGPGQTAGDGEGRNSPYTAALLSNISRPGLPIERVFKEVRSELSPFKQTPWELSSLKGEFYFRPGTSVEQIPRAGTTAVDHAVEQRNIDAARDLQSQKAALEEERRRPGTEKKHQTASIRPRAPKISETGRDGRFIAYNDGIVLDSRTNLMWAAKDNGWNIHWSRAKSYCENYRGGDYTDWRMPTLDELAYLYDLMKTYTTECGREAHLTEQIRITCTAIWASDIRGPNAAIFGFDPGKRYWAPQTRENGTRALPVRSAE